MPNNDETTGAQQRTEARRMRSAGQRVAIAAAMPACSLLLVDGLLARDTPEFVRWLGTGLFALSCVLGLVGVVLWWRANKVLQVATPEHLIVASKDRTRLAEAMGASRDPASGARTGRSPEPVDVIRLILDQHAFANPLRTLSEARRMQGFVEAMEHQTYTEFAALSSEAFAKLKMRTVKVAAHYVADASHQPR